MPKSTSLRLPCLQQASWRRQAQDDKSVVPARYSGCQANGEMDSLLRLRLDLELDGVVGGAAGQGELAEVGSGEAFVESGAAGGAAAAGADSDFTDEVVRAVVGFAGVAFHEGDGGDEGVSAIPEELLGLEAGADLEVADVDACELALLGVGGGDGAVDFVGVGFSFGVAPDALQSDFHGGSSVERLVAKWMPDYCVWQRMYTLRSLRVACGETGR